MQAERYPGERRGLSLFLEDLLPIAEAELGSDSLLVHCARRAVRAQSLPRLRHARQMFNHLPRDTKQRLSAALVAHASTAQERHDLLEAYSHREPVPFVCFEASGHRPDAAPAPLGLRHELLEPGEVRVMVEPGTLPSAAARSLRGLADLIERDRRLLSSRYWRGSGEDGQQEHG